MNRYVKARKHIDFYDKFLEYSSDVVSDTDEYTYNKECNSASGDRLMPTLCNAFKVRAIVIRSANDGSLIDKNQMARCIS